MGRSRRDVFRRRLRPHAGAPSSTFCEITSSRKETSPTFLTTATDQKISRRARFGLAVIVASQLMIVLDSTIVTIALPNIRDDLGFSTVDLSWVINAYALTVGGLLLGGRIRFARRPMRGL